MLYETDRRLDTAKQKFSGLKDRTMETIQMKTMREKRREQGFRELQDDLNRMDICVTGIPRGEGMEQKRYLKIYSAHDFPKFVQNHKLSDKQ